MHELSIVMGIIEIAEKEASKAGVEYFDTIELDIGTLSGIVREALDFAWESAIKGTVLEKAERKINSIKAVARCLNCGTEFKTSTLYEECPACKSYMTTLIKGKELKVRSLSYNN